jgi:hypothetical protein
MPDVVAAGTHPLRPVIAMDDCRQDENDDMTGEQALHA